MNKKIELIDRRNMFSIVPLLQVLSPQSSECTLKERIDEMLSMGYQCVGFYLDEKLIGISGIWILSKYYVGKHIEPDNVIFYPEHAGKGYGTELLNWIFEYGKSQGCRASELNCYIPNEAGQKFWEKHGYTKIGFHYQKIFS